MGIVSPPLGRSSFKKPRMAAVGAWRVPWAPYGRRGGVAGPLNPEWPPWGRGRFHGLRMDALGAWPVPWAPYCRRWGVAGPEAPNGCHGGVAGPLGPVWPP